MGEESRSSDHLEDGYVVPRFPSQILDHLQHLCRLSPFKKKVRKMPCPKCAQDDARCHPSFQLQDGYVAPRVPGQGLDHLHQPCHRSRRRAKQMPCPKCAQDDARCHPSFHLQDGYVAPRFPGQGLDHFHHLSHQSRSRRTARRMPWQWPGPTTGRLGWNGAAA